MAKLHAQHVLGIKRAPGAALAAIAIAAATD
jgi:hypothetical protein